MWWLHDISIYIEIAEGRTRIYLVEDKRSALVRSCVLSFAAGTLKIIIIVTHFIQFADFIILLSDHREIVESIGRLVFKAFTFVYGRHIRASDYTVALVFG